jgi:ribosomal protein L22
MGKYNEKLDSIFKEWIEKSEKNGEARENYDNQKVLFLHMMA